MRWFWNSLIGFCLLMCACGTKYIPLEVVRYDSLKVVEILHDSVYVHDSVTMGGARWNYAGIVEAIIRDKYSVEEMEAITNNMNYVVNEFFTTLVTQNLGQAQKAIKEYADSDDATIFNDMQEWRAMAKKEARSVLKME